MDSESTLTVATDGQAASKPMTINPVFKVFFIRLLAGFSEHQCLQFAGIPFSDIETGSEFPDS